MILEKSFANPDTRPLPPGWHQHYDNERECWYYVQLNVLPPKVSYTHPATLNEAPPARPGAAPAYPSASSRVAPNSVKGRPTTSPKLSAAQLLYASAINKQKATGSRSSSTDAINAGSNSRPETPSQQLLTSSSTPSSDRVESPAVSAQLYHNTAASQLGDSVRPPSGPDRNPGHRDQTAQNPAPAENGSQRAHNASTLPLDEMNRYNNRVRITRPAGPGGTPTIMMTASPPEQQRRHADSLMSPPIYASSSVSPQQTSPLAPSPASVTSVQSLAHSASLYQQETGAHNTSVSPVPRNSGEQRQQQTQYPFSSASQPQSAGPLHSITARQQSGSLTQATILNSQHCSPPSHGLGSDYCGNTTSPHQPPQQQGFIIPTQASLAPQQHSFSHEGYQQPTWEYQAAQPNPSQRQQHPDIIAGHSRQSSQPHKTRPATNNRQDHHQQSVGQLMVTGFMHGMPAEAHHSQYAGHNHGAAQRRAPACQVEQQQDAYVVESVLPHSAGGDGVVLPQYALEPMFGEYQVPVKDYLPVTEQVFSVTDIQDDGAGGSEVRVFNHEFNGVSFDANVSADFSQCNN